MDEQNGWVRGAVGWPAWRLCRLAVVLGTVAIAWSMLTTAVARGQAIRVHERMLRDERQDWDGFAALYAMVGVQWFVIALAALTAVGAVIRYHHELSRGWHGLDVAPGRESRS